MIPGTVSFFENDHLVGSLGYCIHVVDLSGSVFPVSFYRYSRSEEASIPDWVCELCASKGCSSISVV